MGFCRIILILVLFSLSCGQRSRDVTAQRFEPDAKQRLILLVIDGPRYSETWGDPTHQYIPNLSHRLEHEGTVFTNARNTGATRTVPGHVALTTGLYQDISNNGQELPKEASFLQIYRAATGCDSLRTPIISSKHKLAALGDCQDRCWRGKWLPHVDCGTLGFGPVARNRKDSLTLIRAKEHIRTHDPLAMLIQFMEPDVTAHKLDSLGYLQGIRDSDRYTDDLISFIQTLDEERGTSTTIILTNDHGRHLDGVKEGLYQHGCACEGCRHINLMIFGPEYRTPNTVDSLIDQRQVHDLILDRLGLS